MITRVRSVIVIIIITVRYKCIVSALNQQKKNLYQPMGIREPPPTVCRAERPPPPPPPEFKVSGSATLLCVPGSHAGRRPSCDNYPPLLPRPRKSVVPRRESVENPLSVSCDVYAPNNTIYMPYGSRPDDVVAHVSIHIQKVRRTHACRAQKTACKAHTYGRTIECICWKKRFDNYNTTATVAPMVRP